MCAYRLLENSGKMTTTPRMAKTSPVFSKLYTRAELAAMTTRQRNQYETSLKHYWDMISDRETTQNGMKRAHAEGREEGILIVAKNMLSMGLPMSQVSQATGLTIEQLKEI